MCDNFSFYMIICLYFACTFARQKWHYDKKVTLSWSLILTATQCPQNQVFWTNVRLLLSTFLSVGQGTVQARCVTRVLGGKTPAVPYHYCYLPSPPVVPSARCVTRVLSGKTPAVPYHYCTTFLSCCSNSQVCSKDVQWEDICCALPLLLSTFLSCCSNSQVCHKGAQWWDIGCSLPLLFKCYLPLTN